MPDSLVGWARFCAHADSGNGDSENNKFVMKMILPAMSITFISTQLNTGMYNVQLPAWAQDVPTLLDLTGPIGLHENLPLLL